MILVHGAGDSPQRQNSLGHSSSPRPRCRRGIRVDPSYLRGAVKSSYVATRALTTSRVSMSSALRHFILSSETRATRGLRPVRSLLLCLSFEHSRTRRQGVTKRDGCSKQLRTLPLLS